MRGDSKPTNINININAFQRRITSQRFMTAAIILLEN